MALVNKVPDTINICHNKRPPMILIFYHRRPLYCLIYRDFSQAHTMGTYLNSITPYTLYKSECLSAYFVDKTLMLRELFPYVSAGNRHICITRPRRFGKTIMANMISSFFKRYRIQVMEKILEFAHNTEVIKLLIV